MRLHTARLVVMLTLAIFAVSRAADAQEQRNVPRIGYLSPHHSGVATPLLEAFRQGLRELGYVEGQNILIEYRWADGRPERLPDLAAELVRLQVAVIVTFALGVRAAKHATSTIPIVIASTLDAVGAGFVTSLARPGGNITGLTLISTDLMMKRLELLKEAVPNISRVTFLTGPTGPSFPGTALLLKATEVAAQALGLTLQILEVREADDVTSAFAAMAREQAEALYVMESPVLIEQLPHIMDLASKSRLPTLFTWRDPVNTGGLMSYGPNPADMHRRAAVYVNKILKGTKPAELPVEQPMTFELVINLKTANALGLTIPPTLLFQATEIIR